MFYKLPYNIDTNKITTAAIFAFQVLAAISSLSLQNIKSFRKYRSSVNNTLFLFVAPCSPLSIHPKQATAPQDPFGHFMINVKPLGDLLANDLEIKSDAKDVQSLINR